MGEPTHQPVSIVDTNTDAVAISGGVAPCLSGDGYRAMVFHLGVLIRLNQVGLLQQLSRLSSVSRGSITATVLGLKWGDLQFQNVVA